MALGKVNSLIPVQFWNTPTPNVSIVPGIEEISAPVLLKKWDTNLKVINYHLDPLLVPGNSSRLISLYKYNLNQIF